MNLNVTCLSFARRSTMLNFRGGATKQKNISELASPWMRMLGLLFLMVGTSAFAQQQTIPDGTGLSTGLSGQFREGNNKNSGTATTVQDTVTQRKASQQHLVKTVQAGETNNTELKSIDENAVQKKKTTITEADRKKVPISK